MENFFGDKCSYMDQGRSSGENLPSLFPTCEKKGDELRWLLCNPVILEIVGASYAF